MLNIVPVRSDIRKGRPKFTNSNCSKMGTPRTPSTYTDETVLNNILEDVLPMPMSKPMQMPIAKAMSDSLRVLTRPNVISFVSE